VRWRQSSEPMDVVYWLDRMNLSELDFKKVGLNTYMVSGSNKIIRYHSYNEWAINITKNNLETYGYMNQMDEFRVLPEHIKKRIKSYNTHEQLYNAVGGGYYQVLPIHSILSPGTILDGTRLTLRPGPHSGYDFSIISASTHARTVSYQLELSEAFMRVERAMLRLHTLELGVGVSKSDVMDAKRGENGGATMSCCCVVIDVSTALYG
jgi:hypothetical protein